MRNKDESAVKSILVAFMLAIAENGKFVLQTNDGNKDMVKGFIKCFGTKSPFAITCEVCSDKLERLIDTQNLNPSSLSQLQSLNAEKNREQLESADKISIVSDNNITSHENVQNNDCLDIFVSSFPAKVQCDTIVSLILEKTDLQPEFFEVSQVGNPRINAKYRKLTSFKIKARDKASYDKIINNRIWAPAAEAVPFNAEAKTKSRQRKKQKTKPQKPEQQSHHKKPIEKKQLQAANKLNAMNPALKSKNARNKQHVIDESDDQPLNKHRKPSQKSSHPRTGENYRPNKAAYSGRRENRDRGGYRNDRGSNFQDRPGHGSNFHVKRRYNHRPLNHDLKSVLSLLARVLDQY